MSSRESLSATWWPLGEHIVITFGPTKDDKRIFWSLDDIDYYEL